MFFLRQLLLLSPNKTLFLIPIYLFSSSDINLDISAGLCASLLASETRYQYIRCVAPSYRSTGELLLAVGLANGKVALCNFVASTENNVEYSEFLL